MSKSATARTADSTTEDAQGARPSRGPGGEADAPQGTAPAPATAGAGTKRTQQQFRAEAEAIGRRVVERFRDAFTADDPSRQDAPAWLRSLRESAWEAFSEHGLPVVRSDAWKHSPLKEVAQLPFTVAERPTTSDDEDVTGVDRADVDTLADAAFGAGSPAAARIVTVDGHVALGHTTRRLLPEGVRVLRLHEALQDAETARLVERHLARHAEFLDPDHAFVALNTAFLRDAIVVHVARGTSVEDPIQVLHLTRDGTGPANETLTTFPRLLVIAEENAGATVVQAHTGLGRFSGPSTGQTTSTTATTRLTCGVTELVAETGARLHHIKVQDETPSVRHVGPVAASIGRDATIHDHVVGLGGLWVRHETHARIEAEGGTAILDGLYLGTGHQHLDHHTVIEHRAPHGTSRETYKGVLDGHAHTAFLGLVKVHEGAVKSDAEQENRNLILSNHALADSTPQLEIYNDDVKCAHGSTVGRLDEDAVFFLRARGIDESVARRMMTEAFAGEVLDSVPEGPLQDHLRGRVRRWFDEERQG